MKIGLYFRPGIIGMWFNTPDERNTFWTALGEHSVCAEKFGERTIRFKQDAIKSKFEMVLTAEDGVPLIKTTERVPADQRPAPPAKPAETMVNVAEMQATAPLDPVAILPAEQLEAMPMAQPNTSTTPPPMAQPIPEVSGLPSTPGTTTAVANSQTPKVDGRTKAGREAKAKQKV